MASNQNINKTMFKIPPEPKITGTNSFLEFNKKLECDIVFLEGIANLFRLRSKPYYSSEGLLFLDSDLLDSAVATLKSITLCCSIGSFSDANTLTRKLRDDILQYAFFLDIIKNKQVIIEEDLLQIDTTDANKFAESISNLRLNLNYTDDEKVLEAWLKNKVRNLPKKIKLRISFENYMERFRQNSSISHILTEYGLEKYWENLRTKLNDYVHNNGITFSHHNTIRYGNKNLKLFFDEINWQVSYICTFFLILIIMIDSTLIISTDMMDHLELNLTPPDGSQYWIARFVQEYIDDKVVHLHPDLKTFLRDNNIYGMEIN